MVDIELHLPGNFPYDDFAEAFLLLFIKRQAFLGSGRLWASLSIVKCLLRRADFIHLLHHFNTG